MEESAAETLSSLKGSAMVRLIGVLAMLVGCTGALAGNQENKEEPKKPEGDPLHPRLKMETSLGDFVLELDAEKAPATVLNFVQYVEDKFYDGVLFHRIINDYMIQGGGYTADYTKKTEGIRPPIRNEWRNGLKNVRGAIAMARTAGSVDSATCQFFINVVDNARLDAPARDGAGYCAFGKVVEGIETVDKIRYTPVGSNPKISQPGEIAAPVKPVVIKSVRVVSAFDKTKVAQRAKAAEDAEKAKIKRAEADRGNAIKEAIKKAEKETGKKAVTTASGLTYIVLVEGEGEPPKPEQVVKVHYTGWLLDGTKFDSSYDRGKPAQFLLRRVIKGWTEGVGLMKLGGKHKLIIPPELAYGSRGRPKIPPNSVLVFDVELLEIR